MLKRPNPMLMNSFLALPILVLLVACQQTTPARDDGVVTYWVNSSKVDCIGVAPTTCLQVKREQTAGDWQNFYSSIEGFEFQPGYLYRLSVRESARVEAPMPADVSAIRYQLVEVLDKQPDPALGLNDIWMLKTIDGKELGKTAPPGLRTLPHIEINIARRQYFGTDGCNRIRGSIELGLDEAVSFSQPMSTMMACQDMTTADRFNQALAAVRRYQLANGELTLGNDGSASLLVFARTD